MKTKEIAEFLNGNLKGAENVEILRVARLETATENEISFADNAKFAEEISNINASCLLVPENFDAEIPCAFIKVKNPKLAFAKIAKILHPPKNQEAKEHPLSFLAETAAAPTAFIAELVCIGENSIIGNKTQILSGAKIGDNVKIGDNCIIHPNCVIYDNVSIGDDCVIHAGTVIGADGFGFVCDGERGYVKFPQIGTVVIESNVEIGANSCVDRGALGETRIGEGTKIDNLVQIAHNVQIGKRVVIAAQTGISGSTIIEDDCVIGGQVGMGDHATVKSGAIIGSQAGILPGKIVREGTWWGTPVQPLDEYKRQNAMVKGLGRLREDVKELKKKLK
jgi:UDP-3-O-[3-hydroxymyristoyl] glucosamine N-acyltransferase